MLTDLINSFIRWFLTNPSSIVYQICLPHTKTSGPRRWQPEMRPCSGGWDKTFSECLIPPLGPLLAVLVTHSRVTHISLVVSCSCSCGWAFLTSHSIPCHLQLHLGFDLPFLLFSLQSGSDFCSSPGQSPLPPSVHFLSALELAQGFHVQPSQPSATSAPLPTPWGGLFLYLGDVFHEDHGAFLCPSAPKAVSHGLTAPTSQSKPNCSLNFSVVRSQSLLHHQWTYFVKAGSSFIHFQFLTRWWAAKPPAISSLMASHSGLQELIPNNPVSQHNVPEK